MDRIPVCVFAEDPISQVGLAGQLRPRPEVLVIDAEDSARARVALVVTEAVDEAALQQLRALGRSQTARLVLVATQIADADLVSAVEAGISGLVRRAEASADRLVAVIQAAAAGEGTVPPDLLGRLLDQVGRLQRQVLSPRGLHFSGLAEREVQVLRLVADGLDTAEIAAKLCYSQRTVKNVLHDITSRLQLRNRSHAVAYAVRQGLI
ncbi:helix-turn-helix transcriptional regulator [Pilimelia terevasa]|uniref:Helix-turn-helix transcriptional regulator n=1 Tax=Pilimelia terevasa TaxID=53372 RepID=A0A8J3FG15_9ACTN|nr:response regulator transcription factor [Pilimelia terevasa]GGK23183.1 helix-turn-helix transcriptional regulator [Pilimelia terevasa]